MELRQSKEHTQRLFIAIPVPEPISRKLEEWTLVHKESLPFRKWTHPRDYHITLQFLGETPAAKHAALLAALREVQAQPVSLTLHGAGTFGPPKTPRVLWAGVAGNLAGLTALHSEVIKATRTANFEPEDRPYSPHITLARTYAGAAELPLGVISSAPFSGEWAVDRFVLMRTHLNASPMYEVIGQFPFVKL